MNFDRIIAVRNDKTVYRDGECCMKVFNADYYSKADVLNEALNQARAEETGLKIPKVLEVVLDGGKLMIVSEYIKGKTLSELIEEEPERKDEYLEKLVDIQLEMHSKTCPLLIKLRDRMSRKINMADLPATKRYDLYTRLQAMPKHSKVCHGDFNPSNVLISEDGEPYILDWSHATQGNAAADAANTYLMFLLDGDETGADKYLSLFCEKSKTAEEYVRRWIPIVAATRSVECGDSARDMLNGWISEN